MMNWFVNVEEEDMGLVLLHYPVISEISDAATIDKEEKFDSVVGPAFLYACVEFRVGSNWVDLVLDGLTFKEFLRRYRVTVNILRVQRESTSMAVKMTMDT